MAIMIPQGSITPVNVSQALPNSVIRQSAWRFSQRRMSGIIMPGGGWM